MTKPIPRRVFETIFMVAVEDGARVGLADNGAIVSLYAGAVACIWRRLDRELACGVKFLCDSGWAPKATLTVLTES